MKNETYISIDVEADGPIPGRNNMLSFGAAAFTLGSTQPIATFEANLELIPEAKPSPSTMAWWATQPEAWEACRKNLQAPTKAMADFIRWVRKLPGRPVIVGYPVTYDFMFVYWYTMAFGGIPDGERCPYGFGGLDIKTLAWARLGGNFTASTKKNMPKKWFRGSPKHDHVALTDAIGQGMLFVNIVEDWPDGF
jgi:hypothetical protein